MKNDASSSSRNVKALRFVGGREKRDGDSGNTSLFAETELDTSHLISLNDSLDVSFDVTDRASFAVV